MRGWLKQLYPFIETFPQWIALNIAKAEEAFAREILIDNIRVEKWYAKQWMDMTDAFGIARMVLEGFPKYDGREGIHLTKRPYAWMKNHARYDETHPLEALEIILQTTHSEQKQLKVIQAAKRSMEYFHIALEACYRKFSPVNLSVYHRSAYAA